MSVSDSVTQYVSGTDQASSTKTIPDNYDYYANSTVYTAFMGSNLIPYNITATNGFTYVNTSLTINNMDTTNPLLISYYYNNPVLNKYNCYSTE